MTPSFSPPALDQPNIFGTVLQQQGFAVADATSMCALSGCSLPAQVVTLRAGGFQDETPQAA
jgi:hypothetical protein